jgi:RnfABCDGE-type electron transport complex B subunit
MVTMILLAGAVLLVLAVGAALILGWANVAFRVETDPRIDAINTALPGANCGGCGCVGCADYAAAVVQQGMAVDKCTVGGASVAAAIGGIMGVDVKESWPKRPVVHCAATHEQRLQRVEYRGEQTCSAANLVGGVQGCTFGCLGIGDCTRACNYDAIHIRNGLAVVDYLKCVGCGACVKACPRNIISMIPFKADRVLAVCCSNKDFGMEVKAVCKVGCIGCKGCERVMSELFKIKDNLPSIDYEKYDTATDFGMVLQKCPMKRLMYVGKPSPKDLEATKDQEMPKEARADFKTTVDETEWRG